MGDIRPMMPGGLPPGVALNAPNVNLEQQMAEQRRIAGVQLAVQSFHGREVDDDTLIERARRITAFLRNGSGGH